MSEHTPGPWLLEEGDDGHTILMGTALVSRAAYSSHHVVDYDHGVDAEDGDGSQFAEAEANARLIAAAPKMAELLERILDTALPSSVMRMPAYLVEAIKDTLREISGS